jgi:hypothetical protein
MHGMQARSPAPRVRSETDSSRRINPA